MESRIAALPGEVFKLTFQRVWWESAAALTREGFDVVECKKITRDRDFIYREKIAPSHNLHLRRWRHKPNCDFSLRNLRYFTLKNHWSVKSYV